MLWATRRKPVSHWHIPLASVAVSMNSGVLDDMRKVTLMEQI
jgi:hypothetical protein